MFPYIMIFLTVIFFSENFHVQLIRKIQSIFAANLGREPARYLDITGAKNRWLYGVLGIYFVLQFLLPFRYLLYPGKLFWTEEGYRFSWRVMLMEKGGTAFFYIKDPVSGKTDEVVNRRYLTALQEKMMGTQPDMILQYAHYLGEVYKKKGIKDPVVTVQSYVTLNGSGSRLYIDSAVDLAKQKEGFATNKWVLPFDK
jgi:Vitamin K-dependent gamma-carboxylase